MSLEGLAAPDELVRRHPDRHTHGTRIRYLAGCRCLPCRAAAARYETERQRLLRAGENNPLVPAERSLARIAYLRRRGVGLRTICRLTDLSRSSIQAVLRGERSHVRRNTERLILSVTSGDAARGAHVPAGATWCRVQWLRAHGRTKKAIALATGHETPALQLGRQWIRKANAERIRELYERVRGSR